MWCGYALLYERINGEADITIDLFSRSSIFILTKLVLGQETNNTSQCPLYIPQSILVKRFIMMTSQASKPIIICCGDSRGLKSKLTIW